MGTVTKRMLVWLAICFFFTVGPSGSTKFIELHYPKPGGCNENWPCPPRGVCIRRECHCEEHNIIGNGQTWCTVPDHPGGQWGTANCNKPDGKCGHYTKAKCDCGHYKNSYCVTDGIADQIPGVVKYTCKCKEGFFGRPNGPHYKHCLRPQADKDGRGPCITDRNCHELAFCNKDFKCYCKVGYEGNGDKCIVGKDGKAGCIEDSHCPVYSNCKNGKCKCKKGLEGNGGTCKKAPPADCTKDEDCNAKAGCIKGNCVCKGKTVGDGKQACREYQPCPEGQNYCEDSKFCLIDPLFPKQCAALNECEKQGDFCPRLSTCEKNDDGSHRCVCKSGFRMAGKEENRTCEDIDECAEIKHCFATCENTVGSYQCICENDKPTDDAGFCECKCKESGHGDCPKGSSLCSCDDGYAYSKEEDNCVDVNECKEKENPCKGTGQKCVNREGSYDCHCKEGYIKSGNNCNPIITCADIKCKAHEICHEGKTKAKCVKALGFSAASSHSFSLSIYLGVLTIGYFGRLAFTV